jgi:hypothetical protein
MAYDRSGAPINGLEISLDATHKAKSDYAGRFSFDAIAPGNYSVKAILEGYEPFIREILLSSPGDIVYLSLFSSADLLQSAVEDMRAERWRESREYLARALKLDAGNRRAQYLDALILSSERNPERDPVAAKEILYKMKERGFSDPSVDKLLEDLSR